MVCTVCQKQAIGGLTHPVCKNRYSIDGVFPSLVYKGVVKKLVYDFNYPPHLTNMQEQVTDLFYEGIIQKEQFFRLLDTSTVFVPIPLHSQKLKKRGYNQSKLLAEGLAKRFTIPVSDCLRRVKLTKTQVGLSKEDRIKNIQNAFLLQSKSIDIAKKYHNVFLIDDVVTSGATLREAAKVLKKAGVKNVWGLTLAHGE
jgi:competence protein ComFC